MKYLLLLIHGVTMKILMVKMFTVCMFSVISFIYEYFAILEDTIILFYIYENSGFEEIRRYGRYSYK